MTERVYVHIGAYKTGTTFVQTNLWAAREALADAGVLYPGWRGWGDQVRACKHVLGRPDARGEPMPAAPWERLTAAVREWEGPTAIVSYEGLSVATPKQAAAMVAGFTPAEVHVVLTARDLARTIPAMWQEVLQGGQTWTWPQYVETVTSTLGRSVPPGRNFWRGQDLARVASIWADAVGPARLHLVTLPPAGGPPDLLWQRFCQSTGVDPAVINREPVTVHESLDIASTDLMRRLNLAVEGNMPVGLYDRVFKHLIAKEILAAESGPDRVRVPAASWPAVQARSRDMLAELARGGYDIVGTLDDLVVPATPPADAGPSDATTTAQANLESELAAAVRVIVGLAKRVPPPGQGPRRPDAPGRPAVPPDAATLPSIGSRPASRLLRQAYERFRG